MPKHGHCKNGRRSPTYFTWEKMRERCCNPNHARYRYYGGRGIKVCKRWHTFAHFLEDMGERPAGMTLDRKKVDEHYCKESCVWATVPDQNRNQRRHHEPTHVMGVYPDVCGCGVDDSPCVLHGKVVT